MELFLNIIQRLNTKILLLVFIVSLGCNKHTMINDFESISRMYHGNDSTPNTFINGIYTFTYEIPEDSIINLKGKIEHIQDELKKPHVVSSLWFMDDSRFIQISNHSKFDTIPDTSINMKSGYRKGIYHVGTYRMVPDTVRNEFVIILEYIRNNRHKENEVFDIESRFYDNKIRFEKFYPLAVRDNGLNKKLDLETLYRVKQVYEYFPCSTIVYVDKRNLLVDIHKSDSGYVLVTKEKERKRMKRKGN